MKTIWLQAAPGVRCPMEGQPRQYITDAAPVQVPASAYYLRLVADGSLKQAVKPKGGK